MRETASSAFGENAVKAVSDGYNLKGVGAQRRDGGMGIFEKSRNITDTDLRIVVSGSSDPLEALRRHILSLEESQRQLKSSQGLLERQRKWLESSAERKLGLAEEWDKRAATAAREGRDDLARHALLRKKELLRSMSEDRVQLERILPQLEQVAGRLGEVREKILKARSVRTRFGEGGEASVLADTDDEGPEGVTGPTDTRDERRLTEHQRRELDDELRDLKRRLESEG